MPTYEYVCRDCRHQFETWQKMTDEPLTICPECGGQIRRVLFPAGIVFKGSGFYKTDHSNSNSAGGVNGHAKKSETAEPSKESEAKTSSESSSEPPGAKTSESKVAQGTK
jgi:putative FmdB family regulatory protein